MPRLDAIVINCHQPETLAPFYAVLLGLEVAPGDAAAIAAGTLRADEPVLLGNRGDWHVWLVPSPDLQPAPGRIHIDVRIDSMSDIDKLIGLGATHQWDDPGGHWTVLADPQGNLFCAMHPLD